MRTYNKKHKPKHHSKAKWFLGKLSICSLKEKNIFLGRKYIKGYYLVKSNPCKNKNRKFKNNIFKLPNLKIGKKFIFKDQRFKVVEELTNSCFGCAFSNGETNCLKLQYNSSIPECSELLRKDEKNVIFKKCGEK